MAAVLVVGLLSGFAIELRDGQVNARRDVERRFVERATASAALIESLFESPTNSGRAENARRYGGKRVSVDVVSAVARRQRLVSLVVFGESGKLIAASRGTAAAVLRAARARLGTIRRVLRTQPFYLSDVISRGVGKPVIQYAQEVDTRQGRRVLVSGLGPNLLYRLLAGYLARIPNGRHGRAYVIDGRGAVIASTARGIRPGQLVGEPGPVGKVTGADRGRFAGRQYFASRRVGMTRWRVVLASPQRDLLAPVSGRGKWVPWMLFSAFAIVAALALVLLERVLRGADALAATNTRLAQANDALETRVGELHQSQERYALAVRGANDGIWDWDLTEGCLYYSPRWKSILGHDNGEIGSSPAEWITRVHPEEVTRVQASIDAHLAGVTTHFEREHRIRHRDGRYRWVVSRGEAIRAANGKATRIAGSMSDITDRKAAEERLRHDALHDALTGLPNRALFLDRLTISLARTHRERSHRCAVLFFDLDRFKLVNDSFSHAIGDELLITLAGRLAAALRPADTVARLGGDEFTILLDGIGSEEDAWVVARRALAAIERPVCIGGHKLFVAASVGISSSEPGIGPSELMRNADIAMYDAKRHGKGRIVAFNAEMHSRVVRELHVETELRSAIDDRRLQVFYQPIVDLRTGTISALEALARWPAGQPPIPPDQFIAVAEETGLIAPLGRLVLNAACGRLSDWRSRGVVDPAVTVSVNISRWQLGQVGLIGDVIKALENSGLPPDALRLEITESRMVTDPGRMHASLDELERIGVHTHIDDFGTGHSSLTVLHHFPGNTLKIDRSFIATVHEDEGSAAIVRATIALAKNLNLFTTAEGVENQAQLEALVALGCDYAQGYFIARPVAADEAEKLIESWTPMRPGYAVR